MVLVTGFPAEFLATSSGAGPGVGGGGPPAGMTGGSPEELEVPAPGTGAAWHLAVALRAGSL